MKVLLNYRYKIKVFIIKLLRLCVTMCLIFTLISSYTSVAYTENNSDKLLQSSDVHEENDFSKSKDVSDFGTQIFPTISLELTTDYLAPDNNLETNVVNVDIPENINLREKEIKITSAPNNSNFLSLIELTATDGWGLYYPSLKINKILIPEAPYYSSNTLSLPLVAYIPQSINSSLTLNIPPDGFDTKASTLTYIPNTALPLKSYKFHNILGNIYDQSITFESNSDQLFYAKYKSNNLQISETEDPLTLIGISYFAHNLRSKLIKQYFDNVTKSYPGIKDNPNNISKYLMIFNGFSLFSVQKNIDNTHLHPKSFKNFYFNNLPSELTPEDETSNKYIAGAVLFQNPKTQQTYLAISTYKTDKIEDIPIITKNNQLLKEKPKIVQDVIPITIHQGNAMKTDNSLNTHLVTNEAFDHNIKKNNLNKSTNESTQKLVEIIMSYYNSKDDPGKTASLDGGTFVKPKNVYYFTRKDILFAGSTSGIMGSTSCLSNDECPVGSVCRQSICTTCETDNQCGAGKKCCNGSCLEGNCCATSNCTSGQICSSSHICTDPNPRCTQNSDCSDFADLKNCFDAACINSTCIRQPMCPPYFQCIKYSCVPPDIAIPEQNEKEIKDTIAEENKNQAPFSQKPVCKDPNSRIPGCRCIKSTQQNGCSYCERAICSSTENFFDIKSINKSIIDPAKKPVIEKINCPENSGRFIVRSFDSITGYPASFSYSESKLFIFKVDLTQNSFRLTKKSEIDTSTFLSRECTNPVKAAVAGPITFNKTTNEIVIADTNGVNIAKIYKIDFSTDENIKITENGKINVATINDGNITDFVITPFYIKSQYLIFAKVHNNSTSYKLLIVPMLTNALTNANDESSYTNLGRINLLNKQPIQSVIIEDGNNNNWIDTNPVNIVQEIIRDLAKASPQEILEKKLPVIIFPMTNINSVNEP